MDNNELVEFFPLQKSSEILGKRRLIREKLLQILIAYGISELPLNMTFNHIFFRDFIYEDETEKSDKLLNPEEIAELEADVPIVWPKAELEFAKKLLNTILENTKECEDIIINSADNWVYERIAFIDKTIMSIAICEFLYFPEIPPKVTINEAIDLAKKFSTEKSGTFINGVLDNIFIKFKKEGRITKEGKGLKT
jgi:N utilization substance protein B